MLTTLTPFCPDTDLSVQRTNATGPLSDPTTVTSPEVVTTAFGSDGQPIDTPPVTDNVKTFDFGVIPVSTAQRQQTPIQKGTAGVTGSVAPEGGSFNPNAYEMSYNAGDGARGLIFDMAAIGEKEGFSLVIHCAPGEVARLQEELQAQVDAGKISPEYRDKITVVSGEANAGKVWTQDNGDVRGDAVVIPPRINGSLVVGGGGAVERDNTREQKIQLANSLGLPVVESQTYLEGGNVIPGTRADGQPFAMVGRASAETSRNVMAQQLGRPVTDDELKAAIGQDLGIDPSQVVIIDEPGAYHLDLALTVVGPNEVILNDYQAVALMQADWMRADHAAVEPPPGTPEHDTWETERIQLEQDIGGMMSFAQDQAAAEAITCQQLEAAGFTVYRMAGTFDAMNMNFMNSVQLSNEAGQHVSVMLGGDPRAEAYVKQQYENLGMTQVHFTDASYTKSTLEQRGGLRCRTKELDGEVVTQQSPVVKGPIDVGASDVDPAEIQRQIDEAQQFMPKFDAGDFR